MRALPSRQLDKRIITVWRLSALANVLLYAIILICSIAAVWLSFWLSEDQSVSVVTNILTLVLVIACILAVLALIVFVVIVPQIRYIQWRFDVLNEEVDIHKGIFWHKRIIIPLIRVQNVDTRQGPIMRAFKLASITIATAAGEHIIPGLPTEEADALRDRVAVLARIAQEDV
jgi:membrane protein YdbS with pleckstrin-like domain